MSPVKQTNNRIFHAANVAYDKHLPTRGDNWKDSDFSWLKARALDELREFFDNPTENEAGDVVNFMSFMILNKRS